MKKDEIKQLGDSFIKHNPDHIIVLTMLNYHQLLTKDGKKLFDYLHGKEKQVVKENDKIVGIYSITESNQ